MESVGGAREEHERLLGEVLQERLALPGVSGFHIQPQIDPGREVLSRVPLFR